jgi:hypothetical protein
MRRYVVIIAKSLILIVAGMMIMLSIDVFEMDATFWELLGGFVVHSLPGWAVFVSALVLWKKSLQFGCAALAFAFALVAIFGRIGAENELNWGILVLVVPLLLAGSILIWDGRKTLRKS